MNMVWIKRVLVILAAVAVLAAVVMAFLPQPVPVDLAPVTRGSFEQTVDEDGKTRVRERYVVAAPLAGRLQRIVLEAGDPVRAGQVLATIVPSAPALLDVRTEQELRARLGAAEAARARAATAVASAQAALSQSRADYARSRELAAQNFLPRSQAERDALAVELNARELEAARFQLQVAAHEVAQARAALSQARQGAMPGVRWDIRAPVAGRVLKVLHESEGDVPLGEPLLELGDPADLEVVVDVLTTDALQIEPGDPARIERYGGAPLQGRVRLVEPSAFTKISALGVEEQRVNVLIDIVSPRAQWQALGDNYRVDARIVVYRRDDVVKVPSSALFRRGEQWAVFVAADGRAQARRVRLGRRGGLEAEVVQGLTPGEQVIVYPSDAVKDGVRIAGRET
ncbi:MAG: efflux RND transporter periplasmic adaptor subunit [Pseudomonadota bacterium]